MIDQILAAAKHAFMENQLPWLLSAVTDWSYEEGNASDFVRYTELFEESGTPADLARRMRVGINGCLERSLAKFGLDVTERRRTNGCDFTVRTADGVSADLEVKLSQDCTLPKYYLEIARDRERLLASSGDEAYQLVYLVSLPSYTYPAGRWNGRTHRAREIKNVGQASQWSAIQKCLPYPTVTNGGRPVVLDFSSEAVGAVQPYLNAYFANVFQPSSQWAFDSRLHLRDAAVGIALWQCRARTSARLARL